MPILESTYNPSFYFKNNYLNTIYKTLFVNEEINYSRERVFTRDGDFLDLDFSTVGSDTIAICIHGLEGSSESKYIKSTILTLNKANIDAVAINLKGCSGELNSEFSAYHSGMTTDVEDVVNHILSNYSYEKIVIVGFSLGGNLTMKYLGETSEINSKIKAGVAVSVPCNLHDSAVELGKTKNKIYLNVFLKTLKAKLVEKVKRFPEQNITLDQIYKIKNFYDFDNLYTAPAHGFINAEDYWNKSSSIHFLPNIKTPTLLINALDDSFLSKSCFPFEIAKENPYFFLETPDYGGHVGFNTSFNEKKYRWSEHRILKFIKEHL
ncbi:YheT family hydrolase [Aureivirga sp. CE67]|uniref:YheT family hydrolase n=1 Tax=Aureivirga sp. CE67 TaxID=1788983 RepID=UPI0018CA157E|nr:alpha/beta fold hydrolase [Aureivirga sp. CE67]